MSTAPTSGATAPATDDMRVIPGHRALYVLEQLPAWGDLVTIVLHGGSVFEYKGPFPAGEVGSGFYNLKGSRPGFEGHLRLDAIDHIGFQDRPHAGRIAHALTFNDADGRNIFKVFLGRDEHGAIWPEQIKAYEALRAEGVGKQ
ncbi:MAG: heme utilization cystosolic carrier protein HutX [Pseudomonadota bacterium]